MLLFDVAPRHEAICSSNPCSLRPRQGPCGSTFSHFWGAPNTAAKVSPPSKRFPSAVTVQGPVINNRRGPGGRLDFATGPFRWKTSHSSLVQKLPQMFRTMLCVPLRVPLPLQGGFAA